MKKFKVKKRGRMAKTGRRYKGRREEEICLSLRPLRLCGESLKGGRVYLASCAVILSKIRFSRGGFVLLIFDHTVKSPSMAFLLHGKQLLFRIEQ